LGAWSSAYDLLDALENCRLFLVLTPELIECSSLKSVGFRGCSQYSHAAFATFFQIGVEPLKLRVLLRRYELYHAQLWHDCRVVSRTVNPAEF
jgi:hypothetical protein